jgi:hypothetical protein
MFFAYNEKARTRRASGVTVEDRFWIALATPFVAFVLLGLAKLLVAGLRACIPKKTGAHGFRKKGQLGRLRGIGTGRDVE